MDSENLPPATTAANPMVDSIKVRESSVQERVAHMLVEVKDGTDELKRLDELMKKHPEVTEMLNLMLRRGLLPRCY